jgi:tRNA(Ile)-lysidine synthase
MNRPDDIPDCFCRKVAATIQAHAMVRAGNRVLVAASGGPDSMALVRAMLRLAPALKIRIGLAHLHHGLRGPDADRDQAFVQAFAAANSLPCFCETRDVKTLAGEKKLSLEEAGRQARYDFFSRTAADHGFARIATGHTRDDNAEQVLMSLIRGSGLTGLGGIPAKRDDRIIRPLIDCSRQDILAFLDALGQTSVTDGSNQDPAFLRNRVRHYLMPLLEKEYNPGMKQGLHRLSRIVFEENQFLENLSRQAFDQCVEQKDLTAVTLFLPKLETGHPALLPRVIRHAIRHVKTNLHGITHDHIADIRHLAAHAPPGKHLDLPDRIRVYKTRDRICIKKETLPLRKLGRMQKRARDSRSSV